MLAQLICCNYIANYVIKLVQFLVNNEQNGNYQR